MEVHSFHSNNKRVGSMVGLNTKENARPNKVHAQIGTIIYTKIESKNKTQKSIGWSR